MRVKKKILITGLLLSYFVICGSSRVGSCVADITLLHTAVELFSLDVGRYPTNNEGLKVLWENQGTNWRGPYIKKKIPPTDSWGKHFRYRLIDKQPIIDSAGPDSLFDTNDDIDENTKIEQHCFIACCRTGRNQIRKVNWVAGGFSPPAPTPPHKRVRIGRFIKIAEP